MKLVFKYRIGIALCGILVALILATAVLAQQQPAKPSELKYTEIKYSADTSSYKWEGEDRILALVGNVKFAQGDTVLLADKVDYRESTKTANASGNLKIYDDQSTITGDKCIISFKEKKVNLTGNVRMVAKPKAKPKDAEESKSKKTELKEETVITCSSIDYFYKEKRSIVPSAVTITQKNRTITADSALYTGKDEIVQLAGNVKARDEKGKHSFSAPKVTVSLDENNQWVEAEKATGTFYVKDEDEEEPKPAPKPAEKPEEPKLVN